MIRAAPQANMDGENQAPLRAARAMRRRVVDKARDRNSAGRTDAAAAEILKLDRALDSLAEKSPRLAQIVELRFFGACGEEVSAAALGISVRTLRREWQVARASLFTDFWPPPAASSPGTP